MVSSLLRRPFVPSKPLFALPVIVLAGAALLAGCHPAPPAVVDPADPKFVVAEKDNWQITRGDLNTEVSTFLKQHQVTPEQVGPSKMPFLETMTLKNLVLKKLMLAKAAALPQTDADTKAEAAELDSLKQQIPPGQTFDQALKSAGLTEDDLKQRIHEKAQVKKVLDAEAFKNVDPTEQQIDDIYLKNKDSFNIPAKVRASRVLVMVDAKATPADKAAKKKAIDKAHDRVVKGEDFGKVAGEVSEDQSSKTKGGDLGYFQKGENPDAGFDDVAFKTKENAVSPVFLTPLGYQFVKVTAIQPAGTLPIADARGYISSKLKQDNMQKQSQAYATNLLANSGVTYHLKLVDPPAELAPGGPNGAPPQSAPDASAPPADGSAAPAPAPAPAAADQSAPAPAAADQSAPASATGPVGGSTNAPAK
jgi:peptidyl-prolyl cis-trans isomerase C